MIDSYNFGKIRIDGNIYISDVIIYPDHVKENWWRKNGHQLQIADLNEIVKERPEKLIFGTGFYGRVNVLPETKSYLESKGIELIVEKTKIACEIYNQNSENTIAAFHLTC